MSLCFFFWVDLRQERDSGVWEKKSPEGSFWRLLLVDAWRGNSLLCLGVFCVAASGSFYGYVVCLGREKRRLEGVLSLPTKKSCIILLEKWLNFFAF